MAAYKLLTAGVLRVADGASIPNDVRNRDWRAYQDWLTIPGNVADPADPAVVRVSEAQGISGAVQTTNATATELFRAPLVSGQGYIATLDVIGVLAVAPFDSCVIRASIAAKRTPTGAALVGAAVQLAKHADANAATWTAVGAISGTDFVVTVTGQAAKTINWSLSGSFYRFAPGGLP